MIFKKMSLKTGFMLIGMDYKQIYIWNMHQINIFLIHMVDELIGDLMAGPM